MSSEPVPNLLDWCGGPPAIKRLIDAFYDRVEHDELLAADDAELPADPEFRAAFVGYMEWGTRLAFYFSGPGSNEPLPDTSPTPRWGWGDKPPYRP
jgi:hypothetical protein